MRARRPDVSLAEGWRISFGRVFHRNGAAKENERFPVAGHVREIIKVYVNNTNHDFIAPNQVLCATV